MTLNEIIKIAQKQKADGRPCDDEISFLEFLAPHLERLSQEEKVYSDKITTIELVSNALFALQGEIFGSRDPVNSRTLVQTLCRKALERVLYELRYGPLTLPPKEQDDGE